jgi:hypothetical protein
MIYRGGRPVSKIYRVLWSNMHDCGTLGDYNDYTEAVTEARHWYDHMVTIDDDPVQAVDEYAWEIQEVEL